MVNSILILKSDPTFQYKNSIISALQGIDYRIIRMSQFEDVMDIEVTPLQSPLSPVRPPPSVGAPPPPPVGAPPPPPPPVGAPPPPPPPPKKKGRKRRRKQKGRGESKIITVS